MPAAVKDLLAQNSQDIAFVVGNGINRHARGMDGNSWDELLLILWKRLVDARQQSVPDGISLTEFYDILDIHSSIVYPKPNLQKDFCDLMSGWAPKPHHTSFVDYAALINAPVLTTNFEDLLQKAGSLSFFKLSRDQFTDFYPWQCYFGYNQLIYPTDGFGLWHINGMQKYHRSIRLGLTHYMGSVERARTLIHRGNEERLFTGKNVQDWKGAKTWLHIIFNKSLFIFGLGLGENEVFMRWLLLERAKYFRKYPDRVKQGWYLTKAGECSHGKKLFLERIGIRCIELPEYHDIFESIWV